MNLYILKLVVNILNFVFKPGVTIAIIQTCEVCYGSGLVVNAEERFVTCEYCNGTGEMYAS